jgi:hypothetical protein
LPGKKASGFSFSCFLIKLNVRTGRLLFPVRSVRTAMRRSTQV